MSAIVTVRSGILVRDEAACVHCGACTGQCPAGALAADARTGCVEFDGGRCTGCGRCLPACGYGALAASGRPLRRKEGR